MIYTNAIAFLAGLALAAASTWHVQAWRYDAQIAQEFGPWVRRQGLPTSHNAGDWKRKTELASAPRAHMR